jgi:hypothetical protein
MNKIIEVKFGSSLYGTGTPNSDLDLKGIYLPTSREIVLGSYKKTITATRSKQEFERNNKDDVDIEFFSLDRFLELLVQGQTVALDLLFSPFDSYTYSTVQGLAIMSQLHANRYELVNKNVNAFVHYAKAQAAKYGQKGFRIHAIRLVLDLLNAWKDKAVRVGDCDLEHWVPSCGNENIKIEMLKAANGKMEPYLNVCDKKIAFHSTIKYALEHVQKRFDEYGKRALMAEKNEGIDYKALSHAVRVNSEAKELLETGKITFPRPDKDLLLAIKLGQMDYKEIAQIIDKGLKDLEEASKRSTLRETPNKEWAEDLVFQVYSDIVRKA